MRIGFSRIAPNRPYPAADKPSNRPAGAEFGRALKRAIEQVDALQHEADLQAELVATGKSKDIHKAIIAMRQAELSLRLATQVVNRALEAYKEISRMQI